MKALVLGGTGFIGRRLVENLLEEGWDVTIATSGKSPNPFGDSVTQIIADRYNQASFEEKLLSPPYFDTVFDQIGFGPDDIRKTVEFFRERIGNYVFVSSAAVYSDKHGTVRETDFDSRTLQIRNESTAILGYSDGKKNAEAYLFQNAPFPVAAARFPIVMGYDDSTLRFQKHVLGVRNGDEFNVKKAQVLHNYVWVEDAGRFLAWLGKNKKNGAYNAASPDPLSVESLLVDIGRYLGKEPRITVDSHREGNTSYYRDSDLVLSVRKAESEGFRFTSTGTWLEPEVKKTVENDGKSGNTTDHMKWIFEKK